MTVLEKAAWMVAPPDAEAPALAEALGIPLPVAIILRRRGITTVDEARKFLDPRLEDLSDPNTVIGMAEAVKRVAGALRSSHRIAIHGDYDVDGIAATAILVRGLRALGVDPLWYLPHRLRDGYGLGVGAVDVLADRGAELLIAVDCGITAHEAVSHARARGLDVVVLDHHVSLAERPPVAVVEPARGAGAGMEPCAAGLAFLFLWALRRRVGREPARPDELAALAALGTVADVVPLLGDNRRLVAEGLRRLRSAPPVALRALAEEAGIQGPIDAWHVGWQLAPRLNAPGRLGDPAPALDLLLADDPAEARRLARLLDETNRERQAILDQVLTDAIARAEADPEAPAFVFAGEDWHPGVVGLVASRLVEQFRRPAIVIALAGKAGRGSGRSIEGFHLVEALGACGTHLLGFGGHAMAAGLSIASDAVAEFTRSFHAVAGALGVRATPDRLRVDAEVTLPDLTGGLMTELERLGPFGSGNPQPVLAVRGVRAVARRLVGDGAHLRIGVTDGTVLVEAIGFEMAERGEVLTFIDAPVDLAFVPERDRYDPNRVRLRLRGLEVAGVDPDTVLADTGLLVDRLFRRAADYLGEPRYDGAEDAATLYTKVVGVTFEGRQGVLATVRPGDHLRLIREPTNPHDPHAVQVTTDDGRVLGYLNARLAGRLSPSLDGGTRYRATVVALTGGGDRTLGVNVHLEREDDLLDGVSPRTPRGLRGGPVSEDRLRIYLNGGRPFAPALARAFAALTEGRSAGLVMPPGRGRAAAIAGAAVLIAGGGHWALVVSPLRALVEHRAEQLASRLGSLGVRVAAVHGLQGWRDRERAAVALRAGDVDVVMTSAEALLTGDLLAPYHDRIGGVILDGGGREIVHLPAGLAGCPVLALGERDAVELLGRLRSDVTVLRDPAPPAALRIVDRRNTAARNVLEEVVARGEKVVVYAARREECVHLATRLRERFQDRAARIGYVHGGIPVRVRRVITQAFGEGRLDILVATAALDEEALPPDVRQVVIASPPFNRERFLAACGSAGLDHRPATVTLAFGDADVEANRRVLDGRVPGRNLLAGVYRALRDWRGDAAFFWPDEETWAVVRAAAPECPRATVSAACAIFEEAGLAARENVDGRWQVHLVTAQGRRDLEVSLRYREGLREREAFDSFGRWVMTATQGDLMRAAVGRDGG